MIVHCRGSHANSHVDRPTNQQQRSNNISGDDEVTDWNEVVFCGDGGFGGVGFGGKSSEISVNL